jgi:hypothetical protein
MEVETIQGEKEALSECIELGCKMDDHWDFDYPRRYAGKSLQSHIRFMNQLTERYNAERKPIYHILKNVYFLIWSLYRERDSKCRHLVFYTLECFRTYTHFHGFEDEPYLIDLCFDALKLFDQVDFGNYNEWIDYMMSDIVKVSLAK